MWPALVFFCPCMQCQKIFIQTFTITHSKCSTEQKYCLEKKKWLLAPIYTACIRAELFFKGNVIYFSVYKAEYFLNRLQKQTTTTSCKQVLQISSKDKQQTQAKNSMLHKKKALPRQRVCADLMVSSYLQFWLF